MSLLNVFDVAGSGLAAQSVRLNTTASNLANADSVASEPGKAYRARQPVFAAVMKEMGADGFNYAGMNGQDGSAVGVNILGIVESQAPIAKRYEPGNPMADAEGYVYSSNVNTVEAMADMISASRTFQSNIEVINTSKDLVLKTISMGR
jgi:flagellar basal-body rod protein FlgC